MNSPELSLALFHLENLFDQSPSMLGWRSSLGHTWDDCRQAHMTCSGSLSSCHLKSGFWIKDDGQTMSPVCMFQTSFRGSCNLFVMASSSNRIGRIHPISNCRSTTPIAFRDIKLGIDIMFI